MIKRLSIAMGLMLLSGAEDPAFAGPAKAPRMSGHGERPVPGESRFPGEHPRPNTALLGPLGAPSLRLLSERVAIRCRFRGGGCRVTQEYVVRNSGAAIVKDLIFMASAFGVKCRVDGRPRDDTVVDLPDQQIRHWSSSGWGVAPESNQRYKLPGPQRKRAITVHRIRVRFPAGATRTIALISRSVGGFDRVRRGRTQPEVSFALTRRKDNFVYHHELLLRDPGARPHPGGAAGELQVSVRVPKDLVLGASVKLTCRVTGRWRDCTGRLRGGDKRLTWSVAERYRRPVGFFVSIGAAMTRHRVEALLRVGASLMVRSRRDLVAFSLETDAKERVAFGLVYQLFLPFMPHSHEMGGHGELGLVLDVAPTVTPAFRAGAAFHFSFVRVNVLFDLYPFEFKKGGRPTWRAMATAGLGF